MHSFIAYGLHTKVYITRKYTISIRYEEITHKTRSNNMPVAPQRISVSHVAGAPNNIHLNNSQDL